MQLLDNTNAATFYIVMYGPQPATEEGSAKDEELREKIADGELDVLDDDEWFPRCASLPRNVEGPPGGPDAWGLLAIERVDASGRFVLGCIYRVTATRAEPRWKTKTWCVWHSESGALLYSSSVALDAHWESQRSTAEPRLLELSYTGAGEPSGYVLRILATPTFVELRRETFSDPESLDAQRIGPLRAPSHWLVIGANGVGDAALDVVRIDEASMRRVHLPSSDTTETPALSNDGRWVVYPTRVEPADDPEAVYAALGVADLANGHVTIHTFASTRGGKPLRIWPEPREIALASVHFDAANRLVMKRKDEDPVTFALPHDGPFALDESA